MVYQRITTDFSSSEFNSCANHPLQSWEWGEVRKKTGIRVIRIGGYNDNKLKEVYTMTVHQIPHTPFSIGYIPRSIWPSSELVIFLKKITEREGMLFIKFEPDVELSRIDSQMDSLPDTFVLSSHPLFPQWSQELDLTKSEETLMKEMKPKTRYNVHYAEKKGVRIYEDSTEAGYEVFEKLYFDTVERQSYHGHDKSYHQTVWNGMKNGISHILIAEHEGVPLSAYHLFYFKHKLYYPYGGSSDQKRNLMASNLLMWEAIKLGKKRGATSFDMWGSLPQGYDSTNKWAGFTRFKEGYGTRFVHYAGSYDLVLNPLMYQLYKASYTVREFLLQKKLL